MLFNLFPSIHFLLFVLGLIPPTNEWEPINFETFHGTFDGKGYTISGLYINDDNDDFGHYGLFESLGGQSGTGAKAIVQNLGVVNSYIKAKNGFVGGIVSDLGINGIISNCYFEGMIIANNCTVGGICGTSMGGKIESCYTDGSIKATINENDSWGAMLGNTISISGIVGNGGSSTTANTGTSIENCYNMANINVSINNVKSSNILSGHMVSVNGINNGTTNTSITSCYNTGIITVDGKDNTAPIGIGGISGTSIAGKINYCYNYGAINSTVTSTGTVGMVRNGSILGLEIMAAPLFQTPVSFNNNYYLESKTLNAVGGNVSDADKDFSSAAISATETDFQSGEIAHTLREYGYGQALDENGKYIDDKSPVLLAFKENEGTEVYQLKLKVNDGEEETIYRNSKESNLLSEVKYNKLLENAANKDVVWKDEDGNVVVSGNRYTPTEDITLTAEIDYVHDINTVVTPERAGTISVKESAAEGETVSFTVTASEGYEFESVSAGKGIALTEKDGTYSFTMPAEDVTITATFTEVGTEDPTPGEGEGDDDEQGGIVPDAPKYYNIYEEEICEGVTVEFSRDVVKEGQSVLVTVTVDEEFDASDLALKFKRSLFGYWEDLTLTPTENPNEYIIENIYTDIYVRAEGAVPTGIEDIEGAKVYTKDGSIYVYTPAEEQVQIISISGAVLKNETQVGLKQYTGLQRGIYIICIDEARFKVRL